MFQVLNVSFWLVSINYCNQKIKEDKKICRLLPQGFHVYLVSFCIHVMIDSIDILLSLVKLAITLMHPPPLLV